MLSQLSRDLALPPMARVIQGFKVPPAVDPAAEINQKLSPLLSRADLPAGARIAVAVGSRGIDRLGQAVAAVVVCLKEAGAAPFIMPAMGSHGAGTAEGQIGVLAERGVTEEICGAPVVADMETAPMGEIDGIPRFLSKPAHDAFGLVLINRVKPHTNFIGKTESGILKMMAIGLGNREGAEHYHRLALVRDQYSIFSTVGRSLVSDTNFLAGVCLVENQDHRICRVEAAGPAEVEDVEAGLLRLAKELIPGLPLDRADLLIVDEMGKDISGEGIDPCVVGRDCCFYGDPRPTPAISRIVVRALTPASHGSAVGLGQADFCLTSLVEGIDWEATAVNEMTACCPEGAKTPLHFPSDRQMIAAALRTIRPYTLNDLQLVYIKNTLQLKEIWVSKACLKQVLERPWAAVAEENLALPLDQEGMLVSPF